MQKITSTTELRQAIQFLEEEQFMQGQLLKEQFYHVVVQTLQPVNVIKSVLKGSVSSPYLIDNLLDIGLGLATGYLTRRVLVRASGSLFRKLVGSVLQIGVTSAVALRREKIKSFGRSMFARIFRRNEMNHKSRDR